MKYINLKIPEYSYFFGFVQTDGTLGRGTRNRGKLEIEIGERDKDILKSFRELFPSLHCTIRSRNRDTNFKKDYTSYIFGIYDMKFRNEISEMGLPYGKKSEIISPPKGNFCERDYIRGLVDGDGSLGVTSKGLPFISLTVKSEELKDYLFGIIERVVGERKRVNRNRRDSIYNIMVNREKAQEFIKYLYYPDCLALKRKLKRAKTALRWKRPKNMKRVFQKRYWEKWEDEYILTHTAEQSRNYLKRTKNSVGMRLWRFNTNQIKIWKKKIL